MRGLKRGPSFGFKDFCHGAVIGSICPQTVNGFGWKDHQITSPDGIGSVLNGVGGRRHGLVLGPLTLRHLPFALEFTENGGISK